MNNRTAKFTLLAGTAAALVLLAAPAFAQDASAAAAAPAPAPAPTPAAQTETQPPAAASAADSGGLDEIVVTATKRADAQNVQDVGFAVTAFGPAQLDQQHIRSIQGLSYSMPNVQLENVGTNPGYANFSIRGLGVASSIASIDPTVGVFVDGIYLGLQAGVLFGNFDLAGVEVLRGPQGLLFGRNVTGGAVVLRTSTPSDTSHVDLRASGETGFNKTLSGVVSGPLITGKLQAKLAVFYNDDNGYFFNHANNNPDYGASRTLIVRPALRFTPTDTLETILRFEHGHQRGDGAVSVNHGLVPRDSFYVSNDYEGYTKNDWDQLISETNLDVGLGNGKVTNIAGYRRFDGDFGYDDDSTGTYVFNAQSKTKQHQFSEELRYAGTLGNVDVTTGLFYFYQYLQSTDRIFIGAATSTRGGKQKQNSYGAFASFDWHFTDTLTLNAGGRYSYETKQADVSNLAPAGIANNGCDYDSGNCFYGFHDKHSWKGFTPRIGLQYKPTRATQVYGFWARGFRSGGYNFRNSLAAVPPGPFDQEEQSSFEVGVKQEFGRTLRLNLAAFHNIIDGVQRDIIFPVPGVGSAQVIRNAADLRIQGLEGEAQLRLGTFTFSGQFGYTNGKYKKVIYDLNRDNVIDAKDYALKPARLAPWTYGGSVSYRTGLGDFGEFDARVDGNHRDQNFYDDANTGVIRAANIFNAAVGITHGRYRVSAYANNFTNQVTYAVEALLPFFAGSTFTPINKGRVIGAELQFKF